MTAAAIIAIATIGTRMNIFFFLFSGDFSEGDRDDKRYGAVKQDNTKDIEYNR